MMKSSLVNMTSLTSFSLNLKGSYMVLLNSDKTCLAGCIDALWCLSCLVMIGVHHQLTIFQRLMEPRKSWEKHTQVTLVQLLPEKNNFFTSRKNWKKTASWWLNQPVWKIWSSNLKSSPNFGVKMKNIWNHHLDSLQDEENLTSKRCEVFFSHRDEKKLNSNPPRSWPCCQWRFLMHHDGMTETGETQKECEKGWMWRGDVAAWRYRPLLHRLPLTGVFYNIMRYYQVGGWTNYLSHLKNMVKMGSSSPRFGVKIPKSIWVATTKLWTRFFDNSVGYFEQKKHHLQVLSSQHSNTSSAVCESPPSSRPKWTQPMC